MQNNFQPFPDGVIQVSFDNQSNIILFDFFTMPKEILVPMGKQYPFGDMGDVLTEDTKVFVKKILKISCEEEREIIGNMTHFLKVARHQNLINLQQVIDKKDEVILLYEYAPFKLEKWIVTVNEDLFESLQEQMIELAQNLTRSSIKFSFDPDCLGLSKEMTVKYFLKEFKLDFQGQEQHFQELRLEIMEFFKQLSNSVPKNTESDYEKPCLRTESLSTNGSISPLDDLITLTQSAIVKKNEQKVTKNSYISAKVESSMKKSLEALLKFKRMNCK